MQRMKSGLLFLYTSLALVCSHCHLTQSLLTNRYAIRPEAPVFNTKSLAFKGQRSIYGQYKSLTFLMGTGYIEEVIVMNQVITASIGEFSLAVAK